MFYILFYKIVSLLQIKLINLKKYRMKKMYFYFKIVVAVAISLTVLTSSASAQLYINEFMASNDGAFPGPQGDNPDWIEIYNAGAEAVMLGGYYLSDKLDDPEAMYQIPSTYPDSVTVEPGGFILFYANDDTAWSVLNTNFKLSGGGENVGLWNSSMEVVDQITYEEQTTDVSYGRYPDGTDDWFFMTNYTPGAANQSPAPADVVLFINEFMASNDFAFPGPQGDHPDWIEIYNAGMEAVMLGGYYLSDKLDEPESMYQIPSTYPDSVTVGPGEFILFYANDDTAWSVLNTNFKLSGGGEHVGLWSPEQVFLDSITYGPQIADTSYGRYQDGTDNWYMMADYTPGASNTNPNVGPADVMLYINEFMASNDFAYPGPQGDHPDWIEIYNAGDEAVMLGGYYLSDKLDVPEDMYQIPSTYPDSVTVEAGGFIVFYANDDTAWSVLNTNFKLSGGGEHVGLWSPEQVLLDSITYGPQIADTSYGRFPDGSQFWYMMPDFTPGEANRYVDAVNELEMNASLKQNYPNPFSSFTNIEFNLNEPDHITITVYTISGSIVSVLADQHYNTGNHSIQWSASELPSGYYLYSIQTSTGTDIKKASIIR
ncbi:MAG: hypothetical protein C0591_06665 [Marinilabiliales bacterium]|nr:MAG: hypothetical protein C0591_06665 [Marinilabiliales bacterium]